MKIYLLRHAKSSWEDYVNDHSRPLDKRGKKDAAVLADFIRKNSILFKMTLCSSAIRTRETLDIIIKNAPDSFDEIRYLDSLYLASGEEIMDHLKERMCSSILVIGHNPGLSEAISFFAHHETSDYPTCVLAGITSKNLMQKSQVDFIVRPQSGKIVNTLVRIK